MTTARIQLLQNRVGILAFRRYRRPVRVPILQQHRNRSRSATLIGLFDERDVQPNPSSIVRLRV